MHQLYFRDGKVYLPTVHAQGVGRFYSSTPVEVLDAHDGAALGRVLAARLAAGHPALALDAPPPPDAGMPKLAKVRSWGAFAREARLWWVDEPEPGVLEVTELAPGRAGSFSVDPSARRTFRAESREAAVAQLVAHLLPRVAGGGGA